MINFAPTMTLEKPDKKDHILDAAERLISQVGYDGASTRAIAAEASVNMAMLNYYFGSKDGLYKALLHRRMDGFRQTLSDLNDSNISSWEKLHRLIDLYVERIMGNNCYQQIIHRELSINKRSEMTDFITEVLMRNMNEVKRVIVEGVQNGTFRDVDIELTVASIFGTKYYLLNASSLAEKMIGLDLQDPEVLQSTIKPRLKKHLQDLLQAHLTKHDTI